MEADWDEIQRITVPPPSLDALLVTSPASAVAFDTSQELLWVGNEYGRLTSFYGPELRRYTSILAHAETKGPVKQILFCDKGVLSVAPTSVSLCSRRGLTIWKLDEDSFPRVGGAAAAAANGSVKGMMEKEQGSRNTSVDGSLLGPEESVKDLRCVAYMGKDQRFVVAAGHQRVMLQLDVRSGDIVAQHTTSNFYAMMRRSTSYICAATDSGQVDLLDPETLRVVKTLTTSNVRLNDMDARANYLVTCGWVNRPQGGPMLSTLANVYDLRQLIQLPPIPFQPGAAHVQMHPKLSTTCVIASQTGQIQVVDLMNQNMINLRQANLAGPMQVLTMAPTGEALAIADANGHLTLWGSPSRITFAEFSNPTEFQDIPTPVTVRVDGQEYSSPLDIDANVPLNCIGMPYYRDPLLSQWPADQVYDVGSPPMKIDPAIIANLRAGSIGHWASNPYEKTRPRNLAEKPRTLEQDGAPLAAPKFLSERGKSKESTFHKSERRISDIQDLVDNMLLKGVTKNDVPLMYRNVEIKYSKFGIEDFDFEYYNRTRFSGLETHIANSYTNSLLQLFKFTPIVRNLALHHTAANCLSEICLLCELGFLIDMLEKADGQNCQATNFLKAFSGLPEAGRLHLLEEYSHISTLAEMMQSACRFILNQTMADYRRVAGNTRQFELTFAVDAVQHLRCNQCHNEMVKPGSTLTTDLTYQNTPGGRVRNQIPTFSQCLKRSIEGDAQTRGWCDKCRRYQYLQNRRNLGNVPDVLIINALAKSADAKRYWSTPGWLPDRIGISIDGSKFVCFEGEDLRLHLEKKMYNLKVYDLVGVVADIHSGEHQKSHLVSLINVGVSQEGSEESDWHLFNDFLVRKLQTEEALKFFPSWKMPAVLMYQAVSGRYMIDESWKEKLDTTLLFTDWSQNRIPPENCRVLEKTVEAPRAGEHVAIDTEFVSLQQEEIEIKADGEREVVRPTRMGLARVSVLRGAGEEEGVPFINDYITVTEPIVDYLTVWSGVYEGDLDPRTSTHPLVPLKVSYKKLWLLLNLGCIFVGHGLPKDFRIINIHVPRAQVVDTVELFFLPDRHRRLSLRFLAWYLLKEDIQQENHDSIEDARTALKLWRKHEEFKDAGIVETMLEEIYREGKKSLYKPPGEAAQVLMMRKRAETESSGGVSLAAAAAAAGAVGVGGLGGAGGTEGSLAVPGGGGRETPDLMSVGGLSGTVTPVGGKKTGGRNEYFDSPLR